MLPEHPVDLFQGFLHRQPVLSRQPDHKYPGMVYTAGNLQGFTQGFDIPAIDVDCADETGITQDTGRSVGCIAGSSTTVSASTGLPSILNRSPEKYMPISKRSPQA